MPTKEPQRLVMRWPMLQVHKAYMRAPISSRSAIHTLPPPKHRHCHPHRQYAQPLPATHSLPQHHQSAAYPLPFCRLAPLPPASDFLLYSRLFIPCPTPQFQDLSPHHNYCAAIWCDYCQLHPCSSHYCQKQQAHWWHYPMLDPSSHNIEWYNDDFFIAAMMLGLWTWYLFFLFVLPFFAFLPFWPFHAFLL